MSTFDTPHLSLPLRLDGATFVEVDQDSAEHKADRLIATSRTRLLLRDDDPSFGVPQQVFRAQEVDLDLLRAALVNSEPFCAHVVDRIADIDDLRHDNLVALIEEE